MIGIVGWYVRGGGLMKRLIMCANVIRFMIWTI